MVNAAPVGREGKASCLRSYGRAMVALPTSLETPHGRVRCLVVDLSLGGARLEADQAIEPGASLWLVLHKLRVFGTVQWARGKAIGIQFEEKLPKTLVLSLRGDRVDPKALEEVESMLVAQNWVIGTPIRRPKSVRLADVLGARHEGAEASSRSGVVGTLLSVSDSREGTNAETGIGRRALLLIIFSAVMGSLIGLGSVVLL